MPGPTPTPAIDRMFNRLEWVGDCLIFHGGLTLGGYGVVRETLDGKRTSTGAHRVVYRDTIGPIPEGAYVCHTCDNPPCCNPEHLWVGLPVENTADMVQKGRANGGMRGWTVCRRGHDFTPENTYIYSDGRRMCRTCHRVARRAYRQKKKEQL